MNEPASRSQTARDKAACCAFQSRIRPLSSRPPRLTSRAVKAVSSFARSALRFPALFIAFISIVIFNGEQCFAAANEKQVKAVWLYKFLSYTEWPKEAFASETSPFILGIIGDDQIASILKPVANKKVKNRPIELKQFDSGATARQSHVHVLFIGASQQFRLKEILEELDQTNVLTVGETSDFTERGGIINLTYGDAKPLAISLGAMQRSGIKLHSKLQELSNLVK